MKLAAVLSMVSLAAAAALERRHECPGNNCNNAVTGTRPGLLPLSVRSEHCSSFLLTTVTPAATTVIVTVEDDEDYTKDVPTPTPTPAKRGLEGRQVTVVPSSIPDYADNCANAAEYIAGCSCLGVTTGSVTTAPAPTVTVTTTVDYCEASWWSDEEWEDDVEWK